jgi:REP-associated tyrosine transposase
MPRSIRIEFEGAFYHVMARGNRREAIFLDDEDRRLFVQTLGQACAMTGWRVHGWVLLGNHYHLMIETPEANLVAGMKWLQNTVTRRFNVRHRAWGRVFGDRYKAVAVEGRAPFYYETLLDYIHLNPVRAGIVRVSRKESIIDYEWSSLSSGYAVSPGKRPSWLAAVDGLAMFGFTDDAKGRRKMVERLDRRAVEEDMERCGIVPAAEAIDARCSHLRRGWYWGSESFGERMIKFAKEALARPKSRAYRTNAVRRTHGMKQAEQWLAAGLRAAKLTRADLANLKGSDPRKVALARLLWKGTTVSQEWLADALKMRSAANVSQLLSRSQDKKDALPHALRGFIAKVQ